VQQTKVSNVLSEPQRALLSTISAGHEIIVTAEKELVTKVSIPSLGSDPASLKWKETALDTNKQNVSSQIAAMNAATAQVVTLTSGNSLRSRCRISVPIECLLKTKFLRIVMIRRMYIYQVKLKK